MRTARLLAACLVALGLPGSGRASDVRRAAASPSDEATARWSRRLEPLFARPAPPLRSAMEQKTGEGLVLPTAREALKRQVPPAAIARERAESIEWVRRVLRPERLDPATLEELIGVPGALLGADALVGAAGATPQGQTLQVAVTRERLHVRTRMPPASPTASPEERVASAIAFGKQLFQTDASWDQASSWDVREFRGLGLGIRQVAFARDWPESCLVLTDGTAVLYTFLKIHDRESPPARGTALRVVTPWFPRAAVKAPRQ